MLSLTCVKIVTISPDYFITDILEINPHRKYYQIYKSVRPSRTESQAVWLHQFHHPVRYCSTQPFTTYAIPAITLAVPIFAAQTLSTVRYVFQKKLQPGGLRRDGGNYGRLSVWGAGMP